MAKLEAVPAGPVERLRKAAGEARGPAPAPDPTDADRLAGEDRYRLIAEAAYYRAEQRGFQPGYEMDDWLAAEIEVDERLERGG